MLFDGQGGRAEAGHARHASDRETVARTVCPPPVPDEPRRGSVGAGRPGFDRRKGRFAARPRAEALPLSGCAMREALWIFASQTPVDAGQSRLRSSLPAMRASLTELNWPASQLACSLLVVFLPSGMLEMGGFQKGIAGRRFHRTL